MRTSFLTVVATLVCFVVIPSLGQDSTNAAPAEPGTLAPRPTLEDTLKGVKSYQPKDGFVPDEKTAIRIAEAVLISIYGETQVNSERPFKAVLNGQVWTIKGTLPSHLTGGTAVVKLSKHDGRILFLTHQK